MHIGIHAHHSTVTLHNALVHRIRMQMLGEGLGDIVLHRTEESHLRVLTALPSPTYPSRHLLLTAEIWASSLCQPCPHSAFPMPPTPRPAPYPYCMSRRHFFGSKQCNRSATQNLTLATAPVD